MFIIVSPNAVCMKNLFLTLALLFSGIISAQEYRTHKVQPDETVKSIAEKYNADIDAIYELNPDISRNKKLKTNLLVVPYGETPDGKKSSKTVHFKEYEVPPKQTLYSLAKENNISVKDLKKFNPYLYDEELGEGDRIKIPIFSKKKVTDYNESLSNSTFENLLHIVLPKETKFGISKRYEMSVDELEEMNPGLDTLTLKPGQMLKVSNPVSSEEKSENIKIIEVEPKETFYSLTRRLGISRDSLEKLNPNLRERGLEAGMKLSIPLQNDLVETETNLKNQVVDLSDKLVNYDRKKIKVLLPFSLNQMERDTTSEAVIKEDRVLQISLDFYSGVVAALDSVQKMGIPIDAQIIDTQKDPDHIQKVLRSKNWNDTQAVIGPLLINNIQIASQYLSKKDIPVISPLSNKNLKGMKNLLQSRPSKQQKNKTLFAHIDSLKTGKNLLLVADDQQSDAVQKIKFNFPSIKKVTQRKKEYIQSKDFTSKLSKSEPNWVIFSTDKMGLITNSIAHLNKLRETYDIRVFTTDKNDIFEEEVSSKALKNLNFTFPAISTSTASDSDHPFIESYREKYGITPSHLAIRGFDLTMDIVFRLSLKDNFFDTLKENSTLTQYLENRFRYISKPQGGFQNNATFLIKYDDELNFKILN